MDFDNFKKTVSENTNKIGDFFKQNWDKTEDFRKDPSQWIKKNPLKTIAALWTSFALFVQSLSGSALVSLLFTIGGGITGFSLAFGLALLPGIGFVLGLFVGINLTDQQKQDLAQQFKNSPAWFQQNVRKLVEGIQSVWSKFLDAIKKDTKKWDSQQKLIEKASDDINDMVHKAQSEEISDFLESEEDRSKDHQ